MEPVTNGPAQSDDDTAMYHVFKSPACLRVPLILRKVMEHFSNQELIEYSVVNKQWNCEARTLLRYRRSILAGLRGRIQRNVDCQQLADFASHVRNMNVVPFCGMSIDMDPQDHQVRCKQSSSTTLDPTFHVILDRLQWTDLTVSFHEQWEFDIYCPAFMLTKKVLQDFCGVLEHLFLVVPRRQTKFLEQVLSNSTFPRLKTLYLLGYYPCPMDTEQKMFIKTVLSRAPNLQELHLGEEDLDLTENYIQGSSAVLVDSYGIDPYNKEISEDLIGSLSLQRMSLNYIAETFSMERFNRILPMVLQTSRLDLFFMSFNSVFGLSLMRYGISLENVQNLEIGMNDQLERYVPENMAADVATFFRLLKDFDFTRIFPELEKVEIIRSDQVTPWEITQFIEGGNGNVPIGPTPDRAVNIKRVTLSHLPANVPFLASMFPHTEVLEVSISEASGDTPSPTYGLIWEHFNNLKKLEVHALGTWTENVDSLFCGIFPQEVAQLREKDEEYLRAVNIVPVMPSITCMKELRTFTFYHPGCSNFTEENDPTYIFSKVTGLIAFARSPNLSVTIEGKSQQEYEWSHMRNYASVVFV